MSDIQIYESREIGSLEARDGEKFSMVIGLSTDLVAQLKRFSLDLSDEDLQKNTSDYKRFGEGSYEEWFGKERTPYALVSASGALAALAWFGPKPLGRKSLRYLSEEEVAKESMQEKGDWHTIVYRAYNPFRGKGLMTRFVKLGMKDYEERHPNAKFWAGISTKNEASMALASKLGFVIDPELTDADNAWAAMVYEPSTS
jgi:RimJ/RimL family protein N-acetyltransferase